MTYEIDQISNIFADCAIADLTSSCIDWPEALNTLEPIVTSTGPKAIAIGGSNGLSTPVQGSRDMATANGGYFIESAHTGHTTVFNGGNTCIDSLVMEFLSHGDLSAIA